MAFGIIVNYGLEHACPCGNGMILCSSSFIEYLKFFLQFSHILKVLLSFQFFLFRFLYLYEYYIVFFLFKPDYSRYSKLEVSGIKTFGMNMSTPTFIQNPSFTFFVKSMHRILILSFITRHINPRSHLWSQWKPIHLPVCMSVAHNLQIFWQGKDSTMPRVSPYTSFVL